MIPARFDYVRAESVEDALNLLKETKGEGRLIAGGHSLLPLMKFRLATPGTLIDISPLTALKGVRKEGERLIIGALTTYKQIMQEPLVHQYLPVLAETVRLIGDRQVRNRGTIGGNLAHADPVADLPATALALEANIHVLGEDGEREIPIQAFILGPLMTALADTSIITSISFAIPTGKTRSVYLKYAHPASGYAVVGVCAVAEKLEDGTVNHIRVGITGAGDVAYRAISVEESLAGQQATEEAIQQAASLAAEDGEMGQDTFASASYRKHLCAVYTERALKQLLL